MDELAYSLNGENHHYGTPVNTAAPGRVPGGSSSGSAAAVAARQADIGLGSDTGGSVRVPASYCGLWGMRPTHGRVSLEAAAALARSYDTVGWFARAPAPLRAAGAALLAADAARAAPLPGASGAGGAASAAGSAATPRWLVARDAFALAQPEAARAVYDALSGGGAFERVKAVLGAPTEVDVGAVAGGPDSVQGLEKWMDVFRVTQGYEVWQEHGAWVTANNPDFGPGIMERFKWAATLTQQERDAADADRQR